MPQRLPYVGPVAESVDHRTNLASLVRMGASDDGRGLEAERYFARRADRFIPHAPDQISGQMIARRCQRVRSRPIAAPDLLERRWRDDPDGFDGFLSRVAIPVRLRALV